jgi:hypothetical protein
MEELKTCWYLLTQAGKDALHRPWMLPLHLLGWVGFLLSVGAALAKLPLDCVEWLGDALTMWVDRIVWGEEEG